MIIIDIFLKIRSLINIWLIYTLLNIRLLKMQVYVLKYMYITYIVNHVSAKLFLTLFVNLHLTFVFLEPYSAREARNHIKHVHDLLRSVELTDAYLGRDQMSLCFLNTMTGGSILGNC